MSLHQWLGQREYGMRPQIGDKDFIMKRIYTSLEPYKAWNELDPAQFVNSEYGAVFNLEFSPEGNILAAACEKRAIILFDAVAQKQTHRIMEAHSDNVNCIKFLDNRTFATCSDDNTVAIWDIRFLKKRLRSLQGHSNWVKNIEYSYIEGLLVTSGFDGSIFTWDINSYTEEGLIYQKVFNTSGLMRCRISPDCTKLVLCTTGGYMMIIHNLDLTTLHKDLCGFRPTIYRLMQMGNQYIPQAAKFDHIFSKKQKRNRVELVTDFPEENDAEVILALQMHPQGHSVLSRNISCDELTEWSCIHDINEESYDITARRPDKRKRKFFEDYDYNPQTTSVVRRGSPSNRGAATSPPNRKSRLRTATVLLDQPSTSRGLRPTAPSFTRRNINNSSRICSRTNYSPSTSHRASTSRGASTSRIFAASRGGSSSRGAAGTSRGASTSRQASTSREASQEQSLPSTSASTSRNSAQVGSPRPASSNRTEFVPDIWAAEITIQERAARRGRGHRTNSVTGYDYVYAISSGILPMINPEPNPNAEIDPNEENPTEAAPLPYDERHILQNAKKLMFYIQESNKGKGFIKEPSFSSDGRIICSPYNTGVRLLSYSQDCSEHPHSSVRESLKNNPKRLVEVKTINCHSDIVLSSSFSPTLPLLVTGCKLGKVMWHYPNL